MTKRMIASFLMLFILALTSSPAYHAKAEGTQALAIPEIESEVCCGTDSELVENLSSALLAKKSVELQQELGVSAYSSNVPSTLYDNLMPSIGEVKMLVLPLAFPDYPEERDSYDAQRLENVFFAEYDSDKEINLQSVRGIYDWLSYGKMKLTGTVLPLYEMPETSEYYNELGYGLGGAGTHALLQEFHKAIQHYIDSGLLNLDDYDSDGDGCVDSLAIIPQGTSGYKLFYPRAWGMGSYSNFDNANAFIDPFILVSTNSIFGSEGHENRNNTDYDDARTPVHEIGHLLGFPDHYSIINTLNASLLEVMYSGFYFNVYYKWLLGWIEPAILTNQDLIFDETGSDISSNIDLYAVEKLPDKEEETKAVIWIPEPELLPFTEFFIAEYRAGTHFSTLFCIPGYNYFEEDPGIVIWHCNTFLDRTGKGFRTTSSYLQPVRKTKSADKTTYKDGYGKEDIYRKGDVFSSDSQPANSSFYNEDYTGAYMEVLDLTPEKAIIKAGFRDPDLSPPPVVEMSEPSPKAAIYKRYVLDAVTISLAASYKGEPVSIWDDEQNFDYFELYCLEDPDFDDVGRVAINFTKNPVIMSLAPNKDGTYMMTIKKGWITRSEKRSNEVTSEVFYIDNTPPEIKLQGSAPQIIERGEAYTELGAEVTDNLDPDIKAGKLEGKLEIDSSQVNTAKCDTYTVTYTATDHAGNETTVEREVIVQDTTAPTATVSYSTTQPTSGDVVATITPSEPITVTNTEGGSLSYTFTENGSFTFEFEDEAGNKGTATATVSNIDKSLPTGTVSYDIANPTNQNVTATLTVDPTITILNNGGSNTHVFTENGSFEFELQNAAGTKGTVAAAVTWIDKEAPTATVSYSPHKLTNQDVIATITPSEEVTVTSEGGLSHTFLENGSFTFEFEDKAGNKGTATATVDWIDKEPPEITLLGNNPLSLKLGEEYEEPGVEVTDNRDEEIESKLEIDASAVNTEKAGTYTVKYSAADSAGNQTQATRTVKVVDPNASVPIVPTPVLELPFTDVAKGIWYYDPISYAYNNGLFAGLTETEFGPDVSTSRAMLASILYRLEGKPEISKLSSFEDVPAGRYYSEAIAWAAEQGVVAGYDETHFGPNDSITREQLASMLYRYAGSPETVGTLEAFTDSAGASRYARPALCWAVETGILSGKGGGILDPKGRATRAEVASVLERYCKSRQG